MKKKLLAAAVVGALASPVAFAQTLYGIVDVGYQNAKHADGDVNKNFFVSGQKDSSRLGVRGSEDLAGGTYAMYQIEFDIVADTGGTPANGMTNRLTIVGLGSKAWGELTLGRQYTHIFHNNSLGQAARTETFASLAANMPRTVRAANSVKYSSPNFGGFTVGAIYSTSGPDTNTTEPTAAGAESNYWDAGVMWRPGPFGAGAAYGVFTTEAAGVETEQTLTNVSAYWDPKPFGIYLHYAMSETEVGPTTTIDLNAWSASGVFRMGDRNEIYLAYGQREDDAAAGNETKMWGISLVHLMSKRTRIYTGIAKYKNDGGATQVPNVFAAAVGANYDPRGFQLGISHSF